MESTPRRTILATLAASAAVLSLSGCVSVSPPDKPIEINLNVDIRQEVLVRLQDDVEQIIRENPDAFPTPEPQ